MFGGVLSEMTKSVYIQYITNSICEQVVLLSSLARRVVAMCECGSAWQKKGT